MKGKGRERITVEFLTDRIEEKGKILFNVKRVGKGRHDNCTV